MCLTKCCTCTKLYPFTMGKSTNEVRGRVSDFLAAKGVRLTAQRSCLIDIVFSTTRHFTADELLDMARRKDPEISRATVYRTLPLLVESGMLKEMDFGEGRKLYDPNYATNPHHNHLICTDCGRIVEFEDAVMERRVDDIATSLGYIPINKSVQIKGACRTLRDSGTCANKNNSQSSKTNRANTASLKAAKRRTLK